MILILIGFSVNHSSHEMIDNYRSKSWVWVVSWVMKSDLWMSTSHFCFRNGKFIEENEKYILKGSNTELTVRNIINSDAGPYVCKATNKAGEDEKQAFLQVFGKYYGIMATTAGSRDVMSNSPLSLTWTIWLSKIKSQFSHL